jgi:hypothetical protein
MEVEVEPLNSEIGISEQGTLTSSGRVNRDDDTVPIHPYIYIYTIAMMHTLPKAQIESTDDRFKTQHHGQDER